MQRHLDRHHELLAERLARLARLPKGGGAKRLARIEESKRVYGTVKGHLMTCHGVRGLGVRTTTEEMIGMHDRMHAASAACQRDVTDPNEGAA